MSDVDETPVPDDFQRPPGADPNDDADREVPQTAEVIK